MASEKPKRKPDTRDIKSGMARYTAHNKDKPAVVVGDFTATVQSGDIFLLGNHVLMCGNALNTKDFHKLVTAGGGDMLFDLAFTDPPYGVNIIGDKARSIGQSIKKYKPVQNDKSTHTAQIAYDLISKHARNQIIWGGNYFTHFLPPTSCWIVWDKKQVLENFSQCEIAWCSMKKPAKMYEWRWTGMIRAGEIKDEGTTKQHPNQKPVGLTSQILEGFSTEGQSVLDIFGGSGTTLIACEKTHRRCIMMEIDPCYVENIVKRYEKYTGNKAVKL